jgi:putative transposase
MPRKSRKDILSNFLHIMVQGLKKEYIFNKDEEIKKYFKFLLESTKEFNVKIVAYCIMNNHVHLLVFAEDKTEVSKFMKNTNTKYGIYYNKSHNRCGYVFRNRYKVQEIYTKAQLLSCINYIHNNPVKAGMCNNKWDYMYSSYNDYLLQKRFINEELIKECFINHGISFESILKEHHESYKFIEEKCDDTIKIKVIKEFLQKENLNFKELKNNKFLLRKLILELYINYNCTQKEIGECLQINKIKVNRIIKNEI